MRDSIKFSLVGLAGAALFAGTLVSTNHKRHEYQAVKNEMLQGIEVAEHKANDLDHKVNDCIKTVNDCRSVYVQYKTASDEVDLLKNKYSEFTFSDDTYELRLISWLIVGISIAN